MTRREALQILGLQEGADGDEVRRAFRRLAFDLHPDLHPDKPEAARTFQQVNEAYVFLRMQAEGGGNAFSQRQSAAAGRSEAEREATEKVRAYAKKAYDRARQRFHQDGRGKENGSAASGGADRSASAQGMGREDVLRDLLRDPFARRVFEDIYSQIKQAASEGQATAKKSWNKILKKSVQPPGLVERAADAFSGWVRRQIDEEQTVRFAGKLAPGKHIRLQIQQGLMGKTQTIDVTLPPEFEPGRPIRLRGMGKRIGKWRGDLYLRVLEQA